MESSGSTDWWTGIGQQLDCYELPLINPFDPDYPAWPQSKRAIRLLRPRSAGVVVVTDGLGDGSLPEYFLHPADKAELLSGLWATNVLLEIGRLVPGHAEALSGLLRERGLLTLSLQLDGVPVGWAAGGDGAVGLMLGLPHQYATGRPLVSVTLLRPTELDFCLADADEGAALIAERLSDRGDPTVSDLQRSAVV